MSLFSDWKRAVLRAPLHLALSAPVAAASLVVPPLGKAYVGWRAQAEADDEASGRDTAEKAQVDLWSQTVLVNKVLSIWR